MVSLFFNGSLLGGLPVSFAPSNFDVDSLKNNLSLMIFCDVNASASTVINSPFQDGAWFTLFTSTLRGGGTQVAIDTNNNIKIRSLNSGQWTDQFSWRNLQIGGEITSLLTHIRRGFSYVASNRTEVA